MTPEELTTLSPYFMPSEKFANGYPIDWSKIAYAPMQLAYRLRKLWNRPITVVRGAHPNRPEAVDFECVGLPLRIAAMDLLRIPVNGLGLYSAGSFHLDSRPLEPGQFPARWLAVRPYEERILVYEKLTHLVADRTPEWLYLRWSDADSIRALKVICDLSDINNPTPTAVHT